MNDFMIVGITIIVSLGLVFLYDILDHLDCRTTWGLLAVASSLVTFSVAEVHWFLWVLMIFLSGFLIFMATLGYDLWIESKKKPKLVESDIPKMYSRRDYGQEMEDILKEAEKMREELPLVTLWWGLDGLQMNRDGTLEWISKKPKEPEPYSGFLRPVPIPEYPIGGYLQMPADWDFGGMCMRYGPVLNIPASDLEDTTCKIYMQDLRNELNVAQWQEFQNYQTRAILQALRPLDLIANGDGTYSYTYERDSQEKHTL